MLRNPMAWGTYMLRNFVCVSFHSSQGEVARAVMNGCHENDPRKTRKTQKTQKKICVICVICGFFFFIFSE
jgi:hypothetical protein